MKISITFGRNWQRLLLLESFQFPLGLPGPDAHLFFLAAAAGKLKRKIRPCLFKEVLSIYCSSQWFLELPRSDKELELSSSLPSLLYCMPHCSLRFPNRISFGGGTWDDRKQEEAENICSESKTLLMVLWVQALVFILFIASGKREPIYIVKIQYWEILEYRFGRKRI